MVKVLISRAVDLNPSHIRLQDRKPPGRLRQRVPREDHKVRLRPDLNPRLERCVSRHEVRVCGCGMGSKSVLRGQPTFRDGRGVHLEGPACGCFLMEPAVHSSMHPSQGIGKCHRPVRSRGHWNPGLNHRFEGIGPVRRCPLGSESMEERLLLHRQMERVCDCEYVCLLEPSDRIWTGHVLCVLYTVAGKGRGPRPVPGPSLSKAGQNLVYGAVTDSMHSDLKPRCIGCDNILDQLGLLYGPNAR
mmetsp:Transcript_16497/g.46024  ORF Transcript_16497/g.46024 Transcript_16497/m.46024 type:complete len:245 (-) Transcript_16497:468-1202(-)